MSYYIHAYSITSGSTTHYHATLSTDPEFSKEGAELIGTVAIANVQYINPKFIGYTREFPRLKDVAAVTSLDKLIR